MKDDKDFDATETITPEDSKEEPVAAARVEDLIRSISEPSSLSRHYMIKLESGRVIGKTKRLGDAFRILDQMGFNSVQPFPDVGVFKAISRKEAMEKFTLLLNTALLATGDKEHGRVINNLEARAFYWLIELFYVTQHREGWEEGENESEIVDKVLCFLSNYGFDVTKERCEEVERLRRRVNKLPSKLHSGKRTK